MVTNPTFPRLAPSVTEAAVPASLAVPRMSDLLLLFNRHSYEADYQGLNFYAVAVT